MIRYRPESFGYIAAFPGGQVAMFGPGVLPLLQAGAPIEECRPHLLRTITIPQDFHFSAPLMAWLEVTRRCNLRCPHCFVEGGAPRSSELSTDQILGLLDEWAEMGVFCVVITGGEPTLHRDFLEIVEHAWDAGFVVSIPTNGTALTDQLLGRIPQEDVIISMSLDGVHGQGVRFGTTDFAFVTDRLLDLRRRGFNASIMTTTTSENAKDLDTIIHWAIDHDVSLRSLSFVPMGAGDSIAS